VVVSQVFQPKKADVDTAESDTAEGSADAAAEES
jgi:hypothetical protein